MCSETSDHSMSDTGNEVSVESEAYFLRSQLRIGFGL